jgi:flavin reductase (DIM6/NTAB) family NADH-FMN oxidoreductase RutF
MPSRKLGGDHEEAVADCENRRVDVPEPRSVELPLSSSIWSQFFLVAPLVLVGTREEDGGHDLAPKHMAMPLGWQNYYGFVCHPSHATQRNAERTGEFTVSYPLSDQVVQASLGAASRAPDGTKPSLAAIPVFGARVVDGVLVRDSHVWLECELDRVVDGLGENTLIVGRIVAAAVAADAHRPSDVDDAEVIRSRPLLAYLPPARFSEISESFSFPFPIDFRL